MFGAAGYTGTHRSCLCAVQCWVWWKNGPQTCKGLALTLLNCQELALTLLNCQGLALTLLNCQVPCQPLRLFACLLAWMTCSHLANCNFFVLCLGSL